MCLFSCRVVALWPNIPSLLSNGFWLVCDSCTPQEASWASFPFLFSRLVSFRFFLSEVHTKNDARVPTIIINSDACRLYLSHVLLDLLTFVLSKTVRLHLLIVLVSCGVYVCGQRHWIQGRRPLSLGLVAWSGFALFIKLGNLSFNMLSPCLLLLRSRA